MIGAAGRGQGVRQGLAVGAEDRGFLGLVTRLDEHVSVVADDVPQA
jgi:hypothetical protein